MSAKCHEETFAPAISASGLFSPASLLARGELRAKQSDARGVTLTSICQREPRAAPTCLYRYCRERIRQAFVEIRTAAAGAFIFACATGIFPRVFLIEVRSLFQLS